MKYSEKTVVSSLIFKFVEQFSVKITSLLVSIILARMLDVADFGVIAILTVFIHICSAIIEGGLSTSLIQKKDVDDVDYSTVFYTTFGLALVLYVALFFLAPLVAVQYENPEIVGYLRVIGITLFMTPFNAVQLGYVYKKMWFKRLFFATLMASIVSGIAGIAMAYKGYGAWALIFQTIISTFVSVIVLFILVDWKPKMKFSFDKLKEHFSYGWKLLLCSLLDVFYNEMRTLIVGKKYTPEDLAFYNRGDTYPKTIMTSLNTAIQTVMFPVLSSEQDNRGNMKVVMRKSLALTSFVVFPIMAGFAAVAGSFVVIVLTDKWLPCVLYLQLACIIYAIQPINSCNLQAIKALGRSDIFLALDLLKKAIGFIFLFVAAFAFHTPIAIAVSSALYAPIQLMINAYPNKKLLNYSFGEQFKDIFFPLVMSVVMGIGVYLLNYLSINVGLKIIVQILVGIIIYVLLAFIMRVPALYVILSRLKKIVQRS